MSENATTSAPTGRKKLAQGKGRSDAALGHESKNASSPEGAKERRALPNKWRWAAMNEVCTRVQDGTHFSPKEQSATGDFKYITAKNIKHWGLDLTQLTYVPERVHREISKRCNPEKGDVLYIKDGVTTGIATVNTLDEEFSLLSSVALLKPRRDVLDSLFLKYYLNSPEGFRNMTGQMTGTAIKRLILQKIKAALVPVAPLPEQRRIVAEIEKQFTRLEAGVAALRRVQVNLKRYRAAVLKAACEGKLVPTEAELQKTEGRGQKKVETGEHLLKRILAERRQHWTGRGQYKEPAAPDTANLPPLPVGWTWASVEQLTALVTSGSRGWGEFYSDAGPLFIRAQDIKTDSLKLEGIARVALPENAEGTRSSVENSDLLITITGANVTKSAIVRGLTETAFVSQHVALLKPVCREAAAFHFLWIVSPAHGRKLLEQWAYGAGKPGLSLEQVRTLPIALPPLGEQTRIVAEVERRLSVVEELESVVSANLQRATRLRQSILQKAFTGELCLAEVMDKPLA